MANNLEKIKQIIKKGDSRFWLMIFVVFSTSLIFVFWISDLGVRFSSESRASKSEFDFTVIKDVAQEDLSQTFDEFWRIMEEESKKEDNKTNNSVIDVIKIEQAINDKKNEEEVELLVEEDVLDSPSKELEESEETIESLKKRIEELEKNLQKE
ncbi:MAG: hypothetical protein WCZ12_01465 [Patescibacteria group bacterium]